MRDLVRGRRQSLSLGDQLARPRELAALKIHSGSDKRAELGLFRSIFAASFSEEN
jgi:hypothetical protein